MEVAMKTLEELGYEKVEENEKENIYERKDNKSIRIFVHKKKKQVFKHWNVDGYLLATWMSMDELKAVLAILEEKE